MCVHTHVHLNNVYTYMSTLTTSPSSRLNVWCSEFTVYVLHAQTNTRSRAHRHTHARTHDASVSAGKYTTIGEKYLSDEFRGYLYEQ
jgi:hypothetical protein